MATCEIKHLDNFRIISLFIFGAYSRVNRQVNAEDAEADVASRSWQWRRVHQGWDHKDGKMLVYLTQQRRFTFNFYKINKQKHWRWNIWNKLTVKSVVLLLEYMYGDVYDTHRLHVIDAAKLLKASVIDDALLQAMPHIKHYADSVPRRHEILSGRPILAATFLMKYFVLWVQIWTVRGICHWYSPPSRETRYLSKLCFPCLKLS